MAYTAIPDSQIDADSPLISDTFFKLRDNPIAIANGDSGAPKVQAAALATGSAISNVGAGGVTATYLGTSSVSQGKLNTSTGEVSRSTSGSDLYVLPGGSYGFYPQFRASGVDSFRANLLGEINAITTSYTTRVLLDTLTTGKTLYAQQRYINSSPPYNLGDGDIPLFVFALVGPSGEIEGTYTADVPPWAYNGPTRVTADRFDLKTGKKYQQRRYYGADGDIVKDEIEITDSIKNADMDMIPHPFHESNISGKTVVLLDPVETLDLLDLHESGESIADLLINEYLQINNTRIARASPNGVIPIQIRWKDSQRRWKSVPNIAAKIANAKAAPA